MGAIHPLADFGVPWERWAYRRESSARVDLSRRAAVTDLEDVFAVENGIDVEGALVCWRVERLWTHRAKGCQFPKHAFSEAHGTASPNSPQA